MKKINNIRQLKLIANQLRQEVIKMVANANSGHPGGPLGLADIFTVLYFNILNHNPQKPFWKERDRLILSNAHCCAIRYAAMAYSGYFPKGELLTFRKLGSKLQGHPSTKFFPEVESSGGSLGQGLSIAVGMALAAKLNKKNYKIYCSLSDGECQEGQTWEAATAAVHFKATNLIAFIDRNYIQIDGHTEDVMALGNLQKKFKAFGWNTFTEDGHNIKKIISVFKKAKAIKGPTVIIFKTVLGKDVSFMENNAGWHGKPPSKDLEKKALEELEKKKKILKNNKPY